MEFKGTKSEANIQAAFAGESQARNKYTYFAAQAKKEGFLETAELFEVMANNEKEHAKIWFKLLNDGLGETEKNVIAASKGESMEWSSMYPTFAKEAREEGFETLATMFEKVAAIEKDHERQFLQELLRLKQHTPVVEQTPVHAGQRCVFCGYVHPADEGEAPYVCPVCEALGAFE